MRDAQRIIERLMLEITTDEMIRRYGGDDSSRNAEAIGWNVLYNALAYLDGGRLPAMRFTHLLEDNPPCLYCDHAICDCIGGS